MNKIGSFFRNMGNKFVGLYNSFRGVFLNRIKNKINKLLSAVETEVIDEILELLLKAIRLVLLIDSGYRKNIVGFDARYTFRTERGKIAASAVFKDGKMKVKDKEIENTNVKVVFSDGRTMWNFLMAPNPDIFAMVLDNKLRYEGNLNYLLKFAYMAKHLKSMFKL